GYWNQSTLQWEHEGLAVVDDTGEWVEMQISHFSNHDPNYPLIPPEFWINSYPWANSGWSCPAGTSGCFIDAQSGTLQEWIDLPRLSALGEDIAPQLRYSTARANPSAVIDVQVDVSLSGAVTTGNYIQWELYIEGEKTDNYTIGADLSDSGEIGRYRFFWDGRNSQGEQMPPGIYNYAIRVRIPFTGEYCGPVGLIFGNPPDCENYPSGRFVEATEEKWVYGTVALEGTPDASVGDGWLLTGQQRLYEDETGNILVANANRQVEFYSELADELDGRGQYSDAQPQVLGAAAAVPILPPPASGVDVSGLITSDTTWTAA
ncbi:MAG: hypothetical protein GY803_14200, partial [Chloroflexi bacterium]|nr:hypothetical protein [Chloroflexota bacterium]